MVLTPLDTRLAILLEEIVLRILLGVGGVDPGEGLVVGEAG